MIDQFCRVPKGFFSAGGQTFTHTLDFKEPYIQLKYRPVITVSKVEVNKAGYGQTPDWSTLDTTDYIIYLDEGLLKLVTEFPARALQGIRVTYTAGYSKTPEAVKFVAKSLCTNVLHEILQRKVAPVIRVDDWAVRVVFPEAFTKDLQTTLLPYVLRHVSVG